MKVSGSAIKLGSNIDTDVILPGKYLVLISPNDLAKHAMEDVDPDFTSKVKKGDFVVGGRNFGLGSSREHAPRVLKMNGVSAVIAQSVARIFFRNSINIGLPVIIADTRKIKEGNELDVDLTAGTLKNLSTGDQLTFSRLPEVMIKILNEGGLVPYVKKYGTLKI